MALKPISEMTDAEIDAEVRELIVLSDDPTRDPSWQGSRSEEKKARETALATFNTAGGQQRIAELRSEVASNPARSALNTQWQAEQKQTEEDFGRMKRQTATTFAAMAATAGLAGGFAGAGTAGAGAGGTAAGGGLADTSGAVLTGGAGSGGAGAAGAATALPAGGMTATGTTSAAEAAMGGVGAAKTTAPAAGGFDWGSWADSLNDPESLIAIGSGVQGIVAGTEQQEQAKQAQEAANPWGTSGGYALAGQQLQDLMKDPTQVAATDPAYQLRIQGAQRAMGIYGQDSGAMSVAGANASTDWYNQRLQQLGALAGAGLNPAQAGQVGLQGGQAAQDTISTGIGRLAYEATAGGTPAATSTGAPADTVQTMSTTQDLYGGVAPQASIGTSPELQELSKLGTTATPLYARDSTQVRAY